MSLATVERLVEELRNGRPVILVDDEERENEGDIVLPAVHATPGWVNFMIREGRGLLCVAMAPQRVAELGLSPMVEQNTDPHSTMFTVSVDHVSNGTGISAFDRCATIRALAKPEALASDFRRPGHVFPLIAREGGVHERPGHTEASVELTRLAGLPPVAAICEVMADDGRMARLEQLRAFAHDHGLLVGSIADLVRFSSDSHARPVPDKTVVAPVAESHLPTRFGDFRMIGFEDRVTGAEHLALVMGGVAGDPLLVRMHSECLTGDALHSLRCDCGAQLDASLEAIAREGRGALVYLRQEGRGIGLLNKIRAYQLQDAGADTVEANERLGFPADARDFRAGAEILTALGVERLRLLTNNPRKVEDLLAHGLDVVERLPLEVGRNGHNERYLATKAEKLDHALSNTDYHQGHAAHPEPAHEKAL